MEAESRPPCLTSTLYTCVNCIQREKVTAMVKQLACDRCEQNTQDSWGPFDILFVAPNSCIFLFFFFYLIACLSSSPFFLTLGNTGRLLRASRTRKAVKWRVCKWQELQPRNSHLKPLWTPCPKLSQQRPTPPFSCDTQHCRGHSDLQSENWLFGNDSHQEPLNPNCQLLTLLQIATFLLQMKLQMKYWFPTEGFQPCVNCLQACTLQCWPFPTHIYFFCLCIGHGWYQGASWNSPLQTKITEAAAFAISLLCDTSIMMIESENAWTKRNPSNHLIPYSFILQMKKLGPR